MHPYRKSIPPKKLDYYGKVVGENFPHDCSETSLKVHQELTNATANFFGFFVSQTLEIYQ